MENSGGRRLLVPLQVQGNSNGATGGGGGGGGGGGYAVLQIVGYAHSPLPSPTTNGHSCNQPSSIMWPPVASPVPSPRTPGSPAVESPKPGGATAPPQLQQQQQVATTFVQADSSSFKEVVQKLTGSTDEKKMPITMPARYAPRSNAAAAVAPPLDHHQEVIIGNGNGGAAGVPPTSRPSFDVGPRKPTFKLHERRRNNNLRSLGINPPAFRLNGRMSPRGAVAPDLLSPSMLDLPSLVLSPVTPLGGDPFDCPSSAATSETSPSEEEKAIAQKRYYLHPSPLSTPRDAEPQLLPLFPISPREAEAKVKSSSS